MPKLLLASELGQSINILPDQLGIKLEGKKIAFIDNAADPYKPNVPWVEADLQAFESKGAIVEKIDLQDLDNDQIIERISQSDILHINGGSTLYLLKLLQDKNLLQPIRQLVLQDKVIYTGSSAGSMIAGPNLECCQVFDELGISKEIANFNALNLVNFVVLPHMQNQLDHGEALKVIQDYIRPNYSYITLSDNQAIWVSGNKFEILNG